MKEKIYRVFTAFSGYDSQMMALLRLSAMFTWLRFKLIGWSEIDDAAIESHNAAFPEYADYNYGDISKVNWSNVPDFDVMTYSFPCTDVSLAGDCKGLEKGAGTSSSLLWECEKAITIKRPKYCIMENVKSLISNQKVQGNETCMKEQFEKWENAMCRLGYNNYLTVVDAADFGVPQHRERVIMVSIRRDVDDEDPQFSFPKPMPLRSDAINSKLQKKVLKKYYMSDANVLECISTLKAGVSGGADYKLKMPVVDSETHKKSHLAKQYVLPLTTKGVTRTFMASCNNSHSEFKYFLTSGLFAKTGVLEIWESDSKLNKAGVERVELPEDWFDRTESAVYKNVRKQILEIVANLKDNQYIRMRGLTFLESLRFMSVPDEYIARMINTGVSETNLHMQAGNSIVVDVLFHIFKSLFVK